MFKTIEYLDDRLDTGPSVALCVFQSMIDVIEHLLRRHKWLEVHYFEPFFQNRWQHRIPHVKTLQNPWHHLGSECRSARQVFAIDFTF